MKNFLTNSENNNLDIFTNLKVTLSAAFHFSELLKFEIQKSKKSEPTNIFTRSFTTDQMNKYAEYAEEISEAVLKINNIFESLLITNHQGILRK